MSLAESLNDTLRAQTANAKVPPGFDAPGTVDYTTNTFTALRTAPVASEDYRAIFEHDTGLPVPEGLDVVVERATVQRIGAAELFDSEGNRLDCAKQYWYKFKFVPKALGAETFASSIAALQAEIANVAAYKKTPYNDSGVVINIADLQLGKSDRHGGTKETVAGFYVALAKAIAYIKEVKPALIVLAELGDGIENFQNTKTQAQTNDLQLVEQIALHTKLLTYAAVELSKLAPKLIVLGVPSNHAEVREDGKAVGGVHNDYGLLSMNSVKSAMSLNQGAFGHVQFAWPADYEVSITIDVAGVPVGFAHGHYTKGNANNVEKWLIGQFAGNHPLQPARIINTAHFHHLRIQNCIGGRWWLQSPTLDRGSSWLEHISGEGSSQNGILIYTVRAGTWHDMQLLRAE